MAKRTWNGQFWFEGHDEVREAEAWLSQMAAGTAETVYVNLTTPEGVKPRLVVEFSDPNVAMQAKLKWCGEIGDPPPNPTQPTPPLENEAGTKHPNPRINVWL
jgi:hypothetical protein